MVVEPQKSPDCLQKENRMNFSHWSGKNWVVLGPDLGRIAGPYCTSRMKDIFEHFRFFLLLSPTNRKSHLFPRSKAVPVTLLSCVGFG